MPEEMNGPIATKYIIELEKKLNDLKSLGEVSSIILSTLDFQELLKLVLEKAQSVMEAEASSVLLYNSKTGKLEFEVVLGEDPETNETLKKTVSLDIGQGIAGWVAEKKTSLKIDDTSKDDRFFKDADEKTGFKTKSLLAVPLISREKLIGVAEVLNPEKKDCFTEYDVEIFEAFCKQVAIAIENARYHKETVEKEKLNQQLELASDIQRSFLPPPEPDTTGKKYKLRAKNIPAAHIGGDLYDFIELSSGKLGILIGDVSGKGVSAALYMAKLISDFRFTAQLIDTPGETLTALNSILAKSEKSGMFLTATYIILEPETGLVDFSIAGHPPFLWVSEGEVIKVEEGAGPPLGILLKNKYEYETLQLKSNDTLIFLTDGIYEAKNLKGNRYGYNKVVELVKSISASSGFSEEIIKSLYEFTKDAPQSDDITLIELNWI